MTAVKTGKLAPSRDFLWNLVALDSWEARPQLVILFRLKRH
jgi:hypothetical protein